MRLRLTENAPVVLGVYSILVGVGRATHAIHRDAIRRELGESRPKLRIDVTIQYFRRRIHVRVGIVHAKTSSHSLSLAHHSRHMPSYHARVRRMLAHGARGPTD